MEKSLTKREQVALDQAKQTGYLVWQTGRRGDVYSAYLDWCRKYMRPAAYVIRSSTGISASVDVDTDPVWLGQIGREDYDLSGPPSLAPTPELLTRLEEILHRCVHRGTRQAQSSLASTPGEASGSEVFMSGIRSLDALQAVQEILAIWEEGKEIAIARATFDRKPEAPNSSHFLLYW